MKGRKQKRSNSCLELPEKNPGNTTTQQNNNEMGLSFSTPPFNASAPSAGSNRVIWWFYSQATCRTVLQMNHNFLPVPINSEPNTAVTIILHSLWIFNAEFVEAKIENNLCVHYQ